MTTPSLQDPILAKHNVKIFGKGTQPIFFVHGYGCNQDMWRYMIDDFRDDYKVILFDHVGTINTGVAGIDVSAYASLNDYADDVCDVVEELDLKDVIFVGHSVSAMICGLAARRMPERIAHVVMIGPSPHYLNDGDYQGGFERSDIDGLLESIEQNYQGWSAVMAPAIMGRPDEPAYGEELTARFCEQDPAVAYQFAKATFLSDNRADLPSITTPTLVLQCSEDIIAPSSVGEYVAKTMPNAMIIQLEARGHCPNLSSPQETADAIKAYLAKSA